MPLKDDPQALRYRLAYRLAKQGFTASRLHALEIGPRSLLRDLTQGRAQLKEADVAKLAERLEVDVSSLAAQLTADEFNAWSFDSTSTRHRLPVWENAKQAWSSATWSWQDAAATLQMSKGRLHEAFRPQSGRTLLFTRAALLSTALKLENGPRAFLEGVPHRWAFSHEPQSSRVTPRDV